MKKAFGQTVRDLKREVNKNVLKVPKIEQKVLDATSNEPWGPHGSLLAEIAHASKSFNDYQLMMAVLWKRINDIGKNWRHVYKGLTVLEYLVAHGSERVIEDIKEHAYQISTLSDFQYIDHNGKDQGNNVRKKSQNLVLLVNDKERIIELRQKAAANKDKFRNTTSSGGMYKPGSGGYGDRFGYDDDRYDGRYGSREDDRNGYGQERDSSYKDDDRYGKFGDNSGRNGDRYGRDDDYRGRSRSFDDYNYGTRGTSSDRDKDRAYDDDANSSSRESGFRGDEQSQNARHMERKFSEKNIAAPSYEEVVNDAQSPVHNDRVVETAAASAPKTISAPAKASPHQTTTAHGPSAFPSKQGVNTFDEFDPRASASVAASTSNDAEKDRLALTIVTTYAESETYTDSGNVNSYTATSSATYQHSKDPFGDTPFKAAPSSESGFPPQSLKQHQPSMPNASESSNLNWGAAASTNEFDILANIFAPTGPSQSASAVPVASSFMPQAPNGSAAQQNTGFLPQPGFTGPAPVSNMTPQVPAGTTAQHNANLHQQSGSNVPVAIHTTSQTFGSTDSMHLMGQLAIVPQPSQEKFQTKSTVWADTLNRGLVNLNISGSKSNTLADIGIDFDALNRKEKREKPTAAPMASTAAMGKAMGSGSGIGRTGAPRPSLPNPMYGHHGMGRAPGTTMGMAGYNGINQHTGVGMGMNRGMPMSMGVGQGGQIQRPAGMPPGSTISGGYNPNASGRGYAPQPYGGGYR